MDEKVLETTMNEGAVVETTNEMPVEATNGLSTGKKIGIATAVTGLAIAAFFLVKKFVVAPIKAKKAAKTQATDEVVESTDEEK